MATINKKLLNGRRNIRERMELVNQSLCDANFNVGTYLQIEVMDRNLDVVNGFRRQLNELLQNAFDASIDLNTAEIKFTQLKDLISRFRSSEHTDVRWRSQVLDVRQHVEFLGRERDAKGNEIEVYRSGAGKSGGQREKLATTCLAAALRYQLGGADSCFPQYAAVVLDEAFAKADSEFTKLAMQIFENFGFQMIIATPLKSVKTLQKFIGGAAFVYIEDRSRSDVVLIQYDESSSRLKLPKGLENELEEDALTRGYQDQAYEEVSIEL